MQAHLSSDLDRPRRVLIVRIGAMGDVLHAMPAVAALRRLHPEWHIGWAIEPAWMPLLQVTAEAKPGSSAMPLVDRLHSVPTRAWKRQPVSPKTLTAVLALRRELRGEHYDLCVDMQGAIRSAVVGRMTGIGEFVGSATPREAPARWLYSRQGKTSATHVVDQGCELLGAAIGEPLIADTVPLPRDTAAEEWRDGLLARINSTGRFAVIAASAGWGAKEWPAERYGAVATRLAQAGYTPLINAVSADNPLANAVAHASGGSAIVVPCSLGRLTALLRRSSLVIAGDTGPLHLAAALGRPVVGLFGPTDPARNGPYKTRSRVLRHFSSRLDHTRHADPEHGLLQITADEVIAAALELLHAEQGKVEQ
jgi:heptosyltransferase-1